MEIILSILQSLGIIVLVLLGILLFITLIVLFVPVRYKIFGKVSEEDVYIKGTASWFLHFVRAYIIYKDNLLNVEVKILWKQISFTNDNNNSNETSKEKDTKKSQKFFHRIKEKVILIKKKATQIKKIIQDEKNKKAFGHLKEEFYYMINILLPKNSCLKGRFSTGSPDTTGQLFGVICCFPIMLQDNWILNPDFEADKTYFIGEFQGKGRIYFFQLIGIILRIIFDKNCRRLYYFINRLGGHNNG